MRQLFDSNILIDHLLGDERAAAAFAACDDPAISIVSWIEVLVGARSDAEAIAIRRFLSSFALVELSPSVAARAVEIRRAHRVRLSDAVIWASALTGGYVLVTRNTRDFPADDASIRVPYPAS